LAQFPALQGIINNSAGEFGNEGNIKALQAKLARQAGNALPMNATNSGAFNSAVTGALAQPLLQLASEGQAQKSALMGQGLSQLMGQTGQNEMNRFNAERGNYQDQLQTLAQGYQEALGLGEQNMQGARLANNMLSQILGIKGQYAAPEWFSPTYGPNPNYMSGSDQVGSVMSGTSGLAALLGSPGGQSALDQIMALFSGNGATNKESKTVHA
jgi:hypothetical protein